MKKNIELLSPAGSFESLHAAIKAGANAIYFGVEQLNMRSRSANSFSLSNLAEISSICKTHKIRSYITLNTVMYEHDMQLLQLILKEVKKHKIDAVIAADFAVMEKCKQLKIPLHISTQANVSNIESVKFFSAFSDVIVLARELTLTQIENITKEIQRKKIIGISGKPLQIEIFVHGALCMAISGKCYLSLHSKNASANRGACFQNCRRSYTVKDTETNEELLIDNEYIMSPKDLCTINVLDQIINSGIDVLKIEGRSKGPEYVYTVTKYYKEAIKSIEEGTYTRDKVIAWENELKKVYNRGFWEGYYLGRDLGEWTKEPGSIATEKKIFLGVAKKYYSKIAVAEFLIEAGYIKKEDSIMITSPQFGFEQINLNNFLVNGEAKELAIKGDLITFPFKKKVCNKTKLYKIVSTLNA